MRKLLFFLLTALLASDLYASEPVTRHPQVEFKASGIVNIAGIELRKKETRLHIRSVSASGRKIEFSPNIFIEDCETGKRWPLKSVRSEKTGQKTKMADSGETTRILVFPRTDKKTRKINFGEGEHVYIYGISLHQEEKPGPSGEIPGAVFDWIDEELSQASRKVPAGLHTESGLCREPARIVGYINGYDRRAGFSTGTVYTEDKLSGDSLPVIVVIHEDGRFEGNIPCMAPARKNITFRDIPIRFYIEPGQTLAITMEWEDFLHADRCEDREYLFQSIRFSGPLTQINQELLEINEGVCKETLHPKTKAILQGCFH